jgi:hypothetical protein
MPDAAIHTSARYHQNEKSDLDGLSSTCDALGLNCSFIIDPSCNVLGCEDNSLKADVNSLSMCSGMIWMRKQEGRNMAASILGLWLIYDALVMCNPHTTFSDLPLAVVGGQHHPRCYEQTDS